MTESLLQIWREDLGKWVGIVEDTESPEQVAARKVAEAIIAEGKAAYAKEQAAEAQAAEAEEEPVPACNECGSIVGHAAHCSRKGT